MYTNKQIWNVSYPIFLSLLAQNVINVTDTAFLGRVGEVELGASAMGGLYYICAFTIAFGFSTGSQIIMARRNGEQNYKEVGPVMIQGVFFLFMLAAVMFTLSRLFAGDIMRILISSDTILNATEEFLDWRVFGFFFSFVNVMFRALFIGITRTKVLTLNAVVMALTNVLLDYLLIFGNCGFPELGIKGAATALLTAQAVGAGTGLYLLYKKKGGLFRKVPSEHRFFSFDKKCIYEIYTTGIPAALETVFWQVSAIILSKVILFYGNQAFAAYQLGIQAEEITEMPAIGFSTASTTLAARAIGMQDEELRKVYFKEQLKVGVFISSITSVLLIFLPRFFMTLMTDKPELQAIGVVYVFVMGFIQIPQNLSRIYNGTIRAMGYKNAPMLVAGFGIWIVRIPLCMLAAYVLRLPLTIIWIIIAMDQVSRFLLSVGLYYRINEKREQTMNAV